MKRARTIENTGSDGSGKRHKCEIGRQISEMLKKSLALSLAKVGSIGARETVANILQVLQDDRPEIVDYFDLVDFQETVNSLDDCEDIAKAVLNEPVDQ